MDYIHLDRSQFRPQQRPQNLAGKGGPDPSLDLIADTPLQTQPTFFQLPTYMINNNSRTTYIYQHSQRVDCSNPGRSAAR